LFERPLDDIKVVELGSAVSSPLCCLLLAEMGADVIKIEEPGTGDDSRNWGKKINGESLYFAHYNRGKKSCVVNLKSEKGKEVLQRLVERSDVLVENLRPGALDKLGLGYDYLKSINPRLVFCEISGFGDVRSLRDVAAYDLVVQAMSGLMSITGEPDGEPLRIGLPMVDVLTALFCMYSVSLALRWRDKMGQGQKIGVSLLGSALEAVGQWITIYGGTKEVPTRSGNKYPLIAPYEPLRTKDGYIILAVGTQHQWEMLCRIIGRPELANDPRFASNQERIRPDNRQVLIERLSEIFAQKSTGEWAALLREEKIPAGPVNSIDDVVNDKALLDACMLVELVHPTLGTIPATGVVPRFEKSPGKRLGPSPLQGQHTEEVLQTLGYNSDEISEMERTGVVEAPRR
jgi:crotonobetainyl-CoA:carnitine CoA-transferase CaiB-like acyl-CoA transferase